MNTPFRLFLTVFVILLSVISCKKESKKGQTLTPEVSVTVVTNPVPDTDIYANKAVLGATATIKNATAAKGEAWFQIATSESQLPLAPKQGVQDILAAGGEFSMIVYDLSPLTDYFFRAGVSIDGKTVYGEPRHFMTRQAAVQFNNITFSNLAHDMITGSDYIRIVLSGQVSINVTVPSGTFIQTRADVCFLISETEEGLLTNPIRVSANQVAAGGGMFSARYDGLRYGKDYHYKAEVTLYDESHLSPVDNTFHTPEVVAVDLGLSVKWANMNLGAHAPQEYGDYYAWGETEPKSTYTEESYAYMGSPLKLSQENDAAYAKWKGDWRMPTVGEYLELIENCFIKHKTYLGVNGMVFTSKKEGHADDWIFLPAAGTWFGKSVSGMGEAGSYWTSNPYSGPATAYSLDFWDRDEAGCNGNGRHMGRSIRAVCP